MAEAVMFEDGTDKFGVALQQLIEQFTVINMVATTCTFLLERRRYHLLLGDRLYEYLLVESL